MSFILALTIKPYMNAARCPPRSDPAKSHDLRPRALGRKNYLFAGADTGGDRAASMFTIFQTARLNGVNPEAYMRDTLTKIAEGHPISRIEELMPWNSIICSGPQEKQSEP